MKFYSCRLYHVYNQGNNKQLIFFSEENYVYFLKKMRKMIQPEADFIAYCLMPNHFHWMIEVRDSNSSEDPGKNLKLTRKIANTLSSYTQAINKQNGRSGSLFRQKTKTIELQDPEYALTCFLYIHQNPIRARIVNTIGDWKFSSYRDYAGSRNGTLCNINKGRKLLELPADNSGFQKFSEQTISDVYLSKIR